MENIQKIKEMIAKFQEESAIPSIVLTIKRSDNIAVTDSKFGGLPYLPKDYTYPTSSKGEPLKLLAQLNFAQLPKLENFPESGILQFYVRYDDEVGLKEWPTLAQDTFKVIYHKEILPGESQMKDFPEIKFINDEAFPDHDWFPFEGEFLVKGELGSSSLTVCDYSFDERFKLFLNENNAFADFKPFFPDWSTVDRSDKAAFKELERKYRIISNLIWEELEDYNHQISGYPSFTQNDQRNYDNLRKYDTMLFQMCSEYYDGIKYEDEIMWGDSGVANFFINLEDLKNLNFDDVMYNWDCG